MFRRFSAALRAPLTWTALAALTLIAVTIDAALRGQIGRVLLLGVITVIAVAVILVGQSAARGAAVAQVSRALADHEARAERDRRAMLAGLAALRVDVATLRDAVGPDAIDRRIRTLEGALTNVARELNAAGYQIQSIPECLQQSVHGELLDATLSAMGEQARERGNSDTRVLHLPPQWRRGA